MRAVRSLRQKVFVKKCMLQRNVVNTVMLFLRGLLPWVCYAERAVVFEKIFFCDREKRRRSRDGLRRLLIGFAGCSILMPLFPLDINLEEERSLGEE